MKVSSGIALRWRVSLPIAGRAAALAACLAPTSVAQGFELWTQTSAVGTQGLALAPAGDLDGDARGEIFWALPGASVVRTLAGATGAILFEVPSPFDGAALVLSPTPLGDVDGDGVADLAVGAPLALCRVRRLPCRC